MLQHYDTEDTEVNLFKFKAVLCKKQLCLKRSNWAYNATFQKDETVINHKAMKKHVSIEVLTFIVKYDEISTPR